MDGKASGGSGNGSIIAMDQDIMARILNASQNVDPDVLSSFDRNRDLSDPWFFSFLVLYSALICLGATGNGLVVWAVARKRSMRTARNMFIVNLAVSDLLLCVVTMPLTLMEILTKYWPLGDEEFVCKMLGTLQAVSIFVSTISITAIALDRYQVIVYPTGNNIQKLGAILISVGIWVFSLLLASPLFVFRSLEVHPVLDMGTLAYCVEKWPVPEGRAYYSLFSLIFQYVVPIVTVTLAYSRICKKLRYRYVNSSASKRNAGLPVPASSSSAGCCAFQAAAPAAPLKEAAAPTATPAAVPAPAAPRPKQAKDDRRIKRTNTLFISIAVIFGVSWLPLNMFNLAMDLWSTDTQHALFGQDRQAMLIVYALCHMMGMSSACTNPMLYGWLNENFRKEFKEILDVACQLCCCGGAGGTASTAEAGGAAGRRRGARGLGGGWSSRLLRVSGPLGSGKADRDRLHPGRELTNGPDLVTTSLMHADETTSFTNVL